MLLLVLTRAIGTARRESTCADRRSIMVIVYFINWAVMRRYVLEVKVRSR